MTTTRQLNYFGRMILYLAVFFSCALLSAQQSHKDEAEKLLTDLIIAFEQQDLTLHEEIWSPSGELRVIGVFENSNFFGWENFEEHLQKTFQIAKKIDFTLLDKKITLSEDGSTGWFFISVDETIELPTKTISLESMRYTGVIVKENNEWRIIQFHGSIPADSN